MTSTDPTEQHPGAAPVDELPPLTARPTPAASIRWRVDEQLLYVGMPRTGKAVPLDR